MPLTISATQRRLFYVLLLGHSFIFFVVVAFARLIDTYILKARLSSPYNDAEIQCFYN